MSYQKIYIAVLEEVPDHMVPVLVAHAILGAHLKFQDIPIYKEWLANSFKKAVVKVNRKEFLKISQMEDCYLGFENSTLNGEMSCAIPLPVWNDDLPNVLKFAKLWKPN